MQFLPVCVRIFVTLYIVLEPLLRPLVLVVVLAKRAIGSLDFCAFVELALFSVLATPP